MKPVIIATLLFGLTLLAAANDGSISAATVGLADSGSVHPPIADIVRYGIQSLAWLAGAWLAICLLNHFFWDGLVARIARRPVPKLLKTVAASIVVAFAVTGILAFVFNRNVTAVWATSGVIGIVLGLALRNMIQDVFTGIALNLDGSIKQGDWISTHHRDFMIDQYGKVLDIGWRTTRLQLENHNVVVVPNSLMGMMAVTNFAHSDHVSRLQIDIVIDFDVPTDRARRILLAGARAAAAENGILSDPPPVVVVGEPAERGVNYLVRFWGKVDERSPSTLQDAVMTHLLKHLHVAGLTPALPKEDMYIERMPKRLLDHTSTQDRTTVLSRCDLFAKSLARREIEKLAANADIREYGPGDTIVREGEDGTTMFVLAEGVLDVFVAPRAGTGSNGTGARQAGEPVHVGHILAGGILGEMSLLTGEKRSATISTGSGALAYEITRRNFEAVLKQRPAIAEAISALVAERRMLTAQMAGAKPQSEIDQEKRDLKERIVIGMKKVFSGIFKLKAATG